MGLTRGHSPIRSFLLALLSVLCCIVVLMPQSAFAYYDRGSVGLALGSGSVSVQAESSTSVSVTVSPASDGQTQGCGMAECPQTCPAECLDTNGQCICAGNAYTTYYPSVSVTSSNGGVATASYSGGAVQIYGNAQGSATITVTASLRQFATSSTTINVQVTPSSSSSSTSNTTTNNSSSTNDHSGNSTTSNSTTSNGVVASPTDIAQAAAESGEVTEDTVIQMHGRTLRLSALRDDTDVVAKLRQIAGTDEQLTLWRGGTVDHPDYSWVFQGEDIDGATLDAYEGLDLAITLSQKGSGIVATLLNKSSKTLVLDFAHNGVLPAPATIYVASSATMTEDDTLGLYLYDTQAQTFSKVLDGLWVESGYIAFEIDHCSTWVISAGNIATVVISPAATPTQGEQAVTGTGLDTSLVAIIVIAVLVVVVAIAAIALVARRRPERVAVQTSVDVLPEVELRGKPPLSNDPVDSGRSSDENH